MISLSKRIPKISSLLKPFSSLQSVKGMKDMVDEYKIIDLEKFDFIKEKATKIFRKYGYNEALLNIVEHEELFQRVLGNECEIMAQKEMYQFQDLSGRKLVLRPEGTACAARLFIENGYAKSTLPKKLFYVAPMYRYEKPQKGRMRQFYQIGIECMGSADVYSDVEVLMIADDFLRSLKKGRYYQFEINSIGDMNARARYNEALRQYFSNEDIRRRLSEKSQERLTQKNVMTILDSKANEDQKIVAECPVRISDYLKEESKEKFSEIKTILTKMGIKFVENPTLVRGIDYYNDLCFEIKYIGEKGMTKDTLLGGGRYDYLFNQLLGKDADKTMIPALGFGAGVERLILAIEDEPHWKERLQNRKKVGLALVLEKEDHAANEFLRLNGLSILRDFDPKLDLTIEHAFQYHKIEKQFHYFDKKGFDFVIIMGSEEMRNQNVKIKNLKDGTQTLISWDIESIQKFLTS